MFLNWNAVLKHYQELREIPTVPLTNKKPLWFSVQSEENHFVVEAAKEKLPSSKVKGKRILIKDEFERMLALYKERQRGIPVSKKAAQITYHQVYWYGIIDDCLKNIE